MKNKLYLLTALFLFITSCQKREWNNPFGADCPKEIYTPTDFTARQVGDSVVLSWSQPNNQISGFVITSNRPGGSYYPYCQIDKDTVQIIDKTIEGGFKYSYQLYAFAGSNNSNTVTAEITPVLDAKITTTPIMDITANTVVAGGNISSDGGSTITERGVCYSTSQNPTTSSNKMANGSGNGSFVCNIIELQANTLYYVRSYAINSQGTVYGNAVSFTTLGTLATIITSEVTAITATSANCGGIVTSNGGIATTEIGVCYSTSYNPTTSNNKIIMGISATIFSNIISELLPNTTYYVRTYAINSQGISYGNEVNFKTSIALSLASLTTNNASGITSNSAYLSGNVSSDGNATVTEKGVCYSTSLSPTTSNTKVIIGNGTGVFNKTVTGLLPNTAYYVRSYAINSQGTAYGNEIMFTTNIAISLASLTTNAATTITSNSAYLSGNITSDGNATVTERGICYSTASNPTTSHTKLIIGSGTGSFSNTLTTLNANTTYYVRAYAINSQGTAYGNEINFKTLSSATTGTVTDIDGNIYQTIAIGSQVWMVENLKVTRYNDGSAIPKIVNDTIWSGLTTGAYCWYNNNETLYKNTYGALYNWHAVNTGKLAPSGWHVPTDSEWTILTNFLGGETVAGGKLKEMGTSHWLSPNTGAVNSNNFTALPGSQRHFDGTYSGIGYYSFWWSSTDYDTNTARYLFLFYYDSSVTSSYNTKEQGYSVRCVRDY